MTKLPEDEARRSARQSVDECLAGVVFTMHADEKRARLYAFHVQIPDGDNVAAMLTILREARRMVDDAIVDTEKKWLS